MSRGSLRLSSPRHVLRTRQQVLPPNCLFLPVSHVRIPSFIGSHVCARLCHEYPSYKVVAFDKLDYCASATTVQWLQRHANFKFVKGDICNSDLLNYTLEQENIDTILHFAAETHVDNSFGNSLSFTRNNVLGTHILLEAARVGAFALRRAHGKQRAARDGISCLDGVPFLDGIPFLEVGWGASRPGNKLTPRFAPATRVVYQAYRARQH